MTHQSQANKASQTRVTLTVPASRFYTFCSSTDQALIRRSEAVKDEARCQDPLDHRTVTKVGVKKVSKVGPKVGRKDVEDFGGEGMTENRLGRRGPG